MVSMLGQLQGLKQLDLLRNLRYISGVSGGSWSTQLFSYYQPGAPGVARNDDEFLCGNITKPGDLTVDSLKKIVSPTCYRFIAAPNGDDIHRLTESSGTELRNGTAGSATSLPFDIAIYELWEATLKRVGVPLHSRFSWNASIVSDILERNPSLDLNPSDFLLPSQPDHPFPIIGTTLLGPYRLAPFTSKWRSQQYHLLEVTPLYIGVPKTTVGQTYKPLYPWAKDKGPNNLTIGGLIEPFAFGGQSAGASSRLTPGAVDGLVNLSRLASVPFSLANATFASSWAPGETLSLAPLIDAVTSLKLDYFSPAQGVSGAAEAYLFADGGDYENVGIIGMLQRQVREIIVFMNSHQPLHGKATWEPISSPPDSSQINDDFPYFFGVHVNPATAAEKIEQEYSFDYTANQVFRSEDFAPVAVALQEAQASGRIPITRRELVTVDNEHWGIKSGFACNLTVVFLGRAGKWEEELPAELRVLVRPEKDGQPVADYGREIGTGPFAHWPNYETTAGTYPASKANLLADFAGWGVLSEEAIFREALGAR
jgi:hypothetical protein